MSNAEPEIQVFAGAGPGYGSGHLVRMTELRDRLLEAGYAARLFVLYASGGAPAEVPAPQLHEPRQIVPQQTTTNDAARSDTATVAVRVLDARDLDPAGFQDRRGDGARVIALDNRCTERGRYERSRGDLLFHDTLPHPDCLDLVAVLQNALISRAALELADAWPVDRRGFAYSGGFAEVAPVDELFTRLLNDGTWDAALRCGLERPRLQAAPNPEPASGPGADDAASGADSHAGAASHASARPALQHAEGLERATFLREIAGGEVFDSYFGMSMLEAWFLGRRIILHDFQSEIHRELMRFLQDALGVVCLAPENARETPAALAERIRAGDLPEPAPQLRPDGRGYERLLERVAELAGE